MSERAENEARMIVMRIIDGVLRREGERDQYTYLKEVEDNATRWIQEFAKSTGGSNE